MAVQFPDASNRVNWNAVVGTTGALSLSFRINPAGSGNVRVFDFNEIFLLAVGTTSFSWGRNYDTTDKFCAFDSAWTFGTEVHIVVTDDGTDNASGVKAYANGTLLTHTAATDVNGVGTVQSADYLQLGHATIAFPCTLSEIGVWHRVLSTTEISSLAARCAPTYLPNSLKAYMPLWDIVTTAGLREQVKNLTATIQTAGIAKSAHPRIHYPPGPSLLVAPPSATLISTGRSDESDTAFGLALSKKVTPGISIETESALALALSKRFSPGISIETDFAFSPGFFVPAGTSSGGGVSLRRRRSRYRRR